MAEFQSVNITKINTTPITVVDGRLMGGTPKHTQDTWEFTDNANDDYTVVLKVPVDGIPFSVKFACDALTSGTASVGLYSDDGDGTYTAVDIDAFASIISVSSAVALTEVIYEAAATNIVNANKTFWEWAGLSARPAYEHLYIAVTNETGTGAAGTGFLSSDYTV